MSISITIGIVGIILIGGVLSVLTTSTLAEYKYYSMVTALIFLAILLTVGIKYLYKYNWNINRLRYDPNITSVFHFLVYSRFALMMYYWSAVFIVFYFIFVDPETF